MHTDIHLFIILTKHQGATELLLEYDIIAIVHYGNAM